MIRSTPFCTTTKETDTSTQTPLTAYQIMQKIRELEALPFLDDCRFSNSNEQKWFNEFLDKKLTGDALSKKVGKLELKNSRAPVEVPRFSKEEVLECTEKWVKDYIIGMNLCPYANGFNNRRSTHVVQTLGLFAPTEYINLHAQHLLAEKEVVVKLFVFPARANYTGFAQMFDYMNRTEGIQGMIESNMLKMDMFHPDAINPYYLDGKIPCSILILSVNNSQVHLSAFTSDTLPLIFSEPACVLCLKY